MKPSGKKGESSVDLANLQFGRLTVKEKIRLNQGYREVLAWSCLCICGNVVNVLTNELTSGRRISCGCHAKEELIKRNKEVLSIHNKSNTKSFKIWYQVIRRCTDRASTHWNDYGGRGITVCDEWKTFLGFYRDMGDPPTNSHTIDRINVNGNYNKENCRWATVKEQTRNRRNTIWVEYKGKKMCLAELADMHNIKRSTAYFRYRQGKSIEQILKIV